MITIIIVISIITIILIYYHYSHYYYYDYYYYCYNNAYALRNYGPTPPAEQARRVERTCFCFAADTPGTTPVAANHAAGYLHPPSTGGSPGCLATLCAPAAKLAYRQCTLAPGPAWPHHGVEVAAPRLSRSAAAQHRLHHAIGSS